jgi:hypothetical protein
VRLLPVVLAGLVLFALAREVARNWEELREFDWHVAIGPLAASALLQAAMFLAVIETWRQIGTAIATPLTWVTAARTYVYPHLTRYLPGGVWHYAGRAVALVRLGASRASTTYAITLEQILAVVAGATLAGGSLPFWDRSELGDLRYVLLVAPIGLVVAHPRLAAALTNVILRRIGRPPIAFEISVERMAQLLLMTLGASLLNTASSYLLFRAVVPKPDTGVLEFMGIVAIAQTAGFLAVGVPGGLGVREGALVLLLSNSVPSYAAVVFSIVSRLWMIGFDLLAGLVMLQHDRRHGSSAAPPEAAGGV